MIDANENVDDFIEKCYLLLKKKPLTSEVWDPKLETNIRKFLKSLRYSHTHNIQSFHSSPQAIYALTNSGSLQKIVLQFKTIVQSAHSHMHMPQLMVFIPLSLQIYKLYLF